MTSSETGWPEPAPNWPEAKSIWQWGWELRVFGFASLYIVIGLYAVYNISTQRQFYLRNKKLHVFFLNAMLLIFSSTRLTILLWDPYASEQHPSTTLLVIRMVLRGAATSSLTSAFSMLLLIVLYTTNLSLAPPRFQKPGFLIGIWVSNVVYILISDLIASRFNSTKAAICVYQVLFTIWPSLLITVGYALSAYKIRKNPGFEKLSNQSVKRHELVILLCIASVEGFVLFVMSIYMASSETGVFNDSGHVEIWPWFGLQTFLRFLELLTCVVIFLIALKPSSGGGRISNTVLPSFVPI